METVEIKCSYCGKEIYVKDSYVRDKMFCTLGCLDAYKNIENEASVI